MSSEERAVSDMSSEERAEAVADLLDAREKWRCEYAESGDYGDGYAYLAGEVAYQWFDRVYDWLESESSKSYGAPSVFHRNSELRKQIARSIVDNLDVCYVEAEYCRSEYDRYSGPGCCVYSFAIGEEQEQVELEEGLLADLHSEGLLESALAEYNGDGILLENSYYDREQQKRVSTGYVHGEQHGHPYLELCCNPGGQWRYVFSKDTMKEALASAICEYCRKVDG